MRLLEGHDETVARFVANLAPIERPVFNPGFKAFGVIRDDGALVAGVVFDCWRPAFSTLELSGAAISRHAFGPRILAELGEYAFGKLGVFRLWARTSTKNTAARRFLKQLGFIEEGVSAHYYGRGHHAATLRIIRPEWKYPLADEARKAA